MAIANAPLDSTLISSFKEIIGKAWKVQARIHKLFKKIGNIELINNEKIKLKIIGQRTFYEKAKMMFIAGRHHQTIYGVDRMGGQTGRWEDNVFFSAVMRNEFNKVSGTNAVEILDEAFSAFNSKSISPNLILLSPEYNYKDKFFLEDKRFISKMNEPKQDDDLWHFYLGTFNNIPVYTSFSDFLKNKIVVCNFKQAFKMRYKTNPNWFEDELTVDIRLVSEDEAKKRLEENPAKWKNTEEGIVLTDDEALTMIKTSVVIDIWATVDFQILNKEAYIVGYVKSENIIE